MNYQIQSDSGKLLSTPKQDGPSLNQAMINSMPNLRPMFTTKKMCSSNFSFLQKSINQIQGNANVIEIELNDKIPILIAKPYLQFLQISQQRKGIPLQTIFECQKSLLSVIYYSCCVQLFSTSHIFEKMHLNNCFAQLQLDKFKIDLPKVVSDLIQQLGDFQTEMGRTIVTNKKELIKQWITISSYIHDLPNETTFAALLRNLDKTFVSNAHDLQAEVRSKITALWNKVETRKKKVFYFTEAQFQTFAQNLQQWAQNRAVQDRRSINEETIQVAIRDGDLACEISEIEITLPTLEQFSAMEQQERHFFLDDSDVNRISDMIDLNWNANQNALAARLRHHIQDIDLHVSLDFKFIDKTLIDMMNDKVSMVENYINNLHHVQCIFQFRTFFASGTGSTMQFVSAENSIDENNKAFKMYFPVPVQSILLGYGLNACKSFRYIGKFSHNTNELIRSALINEVIAEKKIQIYQPT